MVALVLIGIKHGFHERGVFLISCLIQGKRSIKRFSARGDIFDDLSVELVKHVMIGLRRTVPKIAVRHHRSAKHQHLANIDLVVPDIVLQYREEGIQQFVLRPSGSP